MSWKNIQYRNEWDNIYLIFLVLMFFVINTVMMVNWYYRGDILLYINNETPVMISIFMYLGYLLGALVCSFGFPMFLSYVCTKLLGIRFRLVEEKVNRK